MKKSLLLPLFLVLSVLLFTVPSSAALIAPVSATGYGSYYNSPNLIIDNYIPSPPGTIGWTAGSNVWWYGTEPYFVVDLGGVYSLDKLLASGDNNDTYQIDSSLNGSDWSNLYTIYWWQGGAGWGMDTFDNLSVNASARYLKIYATDGDGMYAVGELQAFGSPASSAIPEPATMSLLGFGLLGLLGLKKRKV